MKSRILRIARWEISHQYESIELRQLIVVLLIILASVGLFYFGGSDAQTGEDLYTVATPQGSPYTDVIRKAPELQLSVISFDGFENRQDEFDLIITPRGDTFYRSGREESLAALDILSGAVLEYNREELTKQGQQQIAYPIALDVSFEELGGSSILEEVATDTNESDSDNERGEDNTNIERDDGQNNDDQSSSGQNRQSDIGSENTDEQNVTVVQDEGSQVLTPGDIQPPLPLESIILAFLFLVPMNFIVQNYASSIFDERIDYSGELLLVTPSSRYDIIIGKTLPYITGIVGISCLIAVGIGASVISVVSSSVIGFAFLSIGFVTGVFVRSYRELTFVFLSLSVFVFAFVIVPSIFTSIHPISIISPLTLVVMDLQGEVIEIVDVLFSLGPLALTSVIMFAYGSSLYREEDLFTQRSSKRKLLDMFSGQVNSWKSMIPVGMSVVPFIFALQLLFVAFVFALPQGIALPVIFALAALTEEIAKSLPVYAGTVNKKLEGKYVYLGAAMSGFGFFIAEQITTVGQLVGLTQFEVGSVVVSGVYSDVFGSGIGLILPLLWIAIHPLTTMISSYGAKKSRNYYILFVLLATIVHILYNAGVVLYVQ